ncbi:hypothetical protein COCNU_01G019960 [Cocos nucifera]|uniref:Uncharacterized protein n=1 Tax=Cocos nucifera TaxID=13894 RepID=A0A8K0MVM2_COCNU|nr:hypothetical protein COCNU_01G019960 [Cocos nucifera]
MRRAAIRSRPRPSSDLTVRHRQLPQPSPPAVCSATGILRLRHHCPPSLSLSLAARHAASPWIVDIPTPFEREFMLALAPRFLPSLGPG